MKSRFGFELTNLNVMGCMVESCKISVEVEMSDSAADKYLGTMAEVAQQFSSFVEEMAKREL